MPSKNHEQRIAELEQEMARLRNRLVALSDSEPWWERIAGTFEKDPIYEKAMKLGREYRQQQKTGPSSRRPKR